MPLKDKTGPLGKGPLTGRQEGPCEGGRTEIENGRLGKGFGRNRGRCWGRGFGRGFRRFPITNIKDNLKEYRESLEKELKEVKKEEESLK